MYPTFENIKVRTRFKRYGYETLCVISAFEFHAAEFKRLPKSSLGDQEPQVGYTSSTVRVSTFFFLRVLTKVRFPLHQIELEKLH